MPVVLERIVPQRVVQGVLAARSARLMAMLADRSITLELCPTSDLTLGVFIPCGRCARCWGNLRELVFGSPSTRTGWQCTKLPFRKSLRCLAVFAAGARCCSSRARKDACAADFLKQSTMDNPSEGLWVQAGAYSPRCGATLCLKCQKFNLRQRSGRRMAGSVVWISGCG